MLYEYISEHVMISTHIKTQYLPQLLHDRLQKSFNLPIVLFAQFDNGGIEKSSEQKSAPKRDRPLHVRLLQANPG